MSHPIGSGSSPVAHSQGVLCASGTERQSPGARLALIGQLQIDVVFDQIVGHSGEGGATPLTVSGRFSANDYLVVREAVMGGAGVVAHES